MQGGPGARQLGWVVSDDVQGIVMSGAMGPYPRIGALQASATAVSSMSSGIVASSGAMATATQSASIVGFKELATS